jgi:serine/threonine protein kinase
MEEIANAGAYSEETAKYLYRQVLEAIEYLHEKGVCHRDIKPSNILVTKDRQRVYLADFNVAKQKPITQDPNAEFKMYTRSAGTLAYVAPERLNSV